MQGQIKRCLPNDGRTWRMNLSFTEYHVYSLIDKYCRGLNFRHVLVLMNILREENRHELSILNNELLVNTLFNVSQKHIDDLRTKENWVHMVMQTLSEYLKNNFLPSFYLPRQNLLSCYHISPKEQTRASKALDVILAGLKRNPRNIYKFSGSFDPSDGRSRAETKQSYHQSQSRGADDSAHKQLEHHIEGVESSEGEEETGFFEDASVANSGWPVENTNAKTSENCYMYREEQPEQQHQQQQQQFEDDSGISKPTRVGERSDIY